MKRWTFFSGHSVEVDVVTSIVISVADCSSNYLTCSTQLP